jgi:tRNA 2-selenouridine synthase SelU
MHKYRTLPDLTLPAGKDKEKEAYIAAYKKQGHPVHYIGGHPRVPGAATHGRLLLAMAAMQLQHLAVH